MSRPNTRDPAVDKKRRVWGAPGCGEMLPALLPSCPACESRWCESRYLPSTTRRC